KRWEWDSINPPERWETARQLQQAIELAESYLATKLSLPNPAPASGADESREPDSQKIRFTEGIDFSDDFRSATWFGEEYTFTTMQAACVKVMWENLERRTPAEHQLTILDKAGSSGERLRDVFAKGK